MFKYYSSLIFLFVLDRLSKIYVVNKTPHGAFIDFQLNNQMAFSLPVDYFILYPLVILLLVFISSFWLKNYQRGTILIWPWGMLIIGAVSNLLDRLHYGGVVDFISVPYFTVFNISDIYISVAVVWIFWYELIYKKRVLDRKKQSD